MYGKHESKNIEPKSSRKNGVKSRLTFAILQENTTVNDIIGQFKIALTIVMRSKFLTALFVFSSDSSEPS